MRWQREVVPKGVRPWQMVTPWGQLGLVLGLGALWGLAVGWMSWAFWPSLSLPVRAVYVALGVVGLVLPGWLAWRWRRREVYMRTEMGRWVDRLPPPSGLTPEDLAACADPYYYRGAGGDVGPPWQEVVQVTVFVALAGGLAVAIYLLVSMLQGGGGA